MPDKNGTESERVIEQRRKLRDRSWDAFAEALHASQLGPTALGAALGEDPATISNWKRGAGRPAIRRLPEISSAIGRDPHYLAEMMGAIPERQPLDVQTSETARSLVRLRERELQLRALTSDHRDRHLGDLAVAACATGEWKLLIEPVVEHLPLGTVHLSDSISFAHVSGQRATVAGVRNLFGHELDAIYAFPAQTTSHGLTWTIPKLAGEFAPDRQAEIRCARPISIVTHARKVKVDIVAAITARILGMGHTSSYFTSSELYGDANQADFDPSMFDRNRLHHEWLTQPRQNWVWSHSAPPHSDLRAWLGVGSSARCFWLTHSVPENMTVHTGDRRKPPRVREELGLRVSLNAIASDNLEVVAISEAKGSSPGLRRHLQSVAVILDDLVRNALISKRSLDDRLTQLASSGPDPGIRVIAQTLAKARGSRA